MGENEQGGMLRTVVVVGLVALTATDSHSPISVKVDSVEAATYDDKYFHLDD